MPKQKAFLLLETIIVLFVLSLIIFPWYGFISVINKDDYMVKLLDYFATKEVFIDAYNGNILGPEHESGNRMFVIGEDSDTFYVQLVLDGKIKEEIKGRRK